MTDQHIPTAAENARGEELSAWAEQLPERPVRARVERSEGDGAGRALLEAALGTVEVERIGRGRPALAGTPTGKSPTRTFRFPRDLDAALAAQALTEHRKPSELVRDAVATYLSSHQAS